ncbi:MAG: AAA family ATPase [Bacilli bacterium]|nr:ATP-binding protein [Erysipelotrichaceae bacterium]MDD6249959.1 AAA family ATPase [Bacillales bacterium]MDY2746402.1 AAA family ATPase [Bacilli bacterium]MDD7382487.1 AAA family ATPase [Bacillales bacterium]MDY3890432.1 AAA family ATPase [Bacilli bacterium]
MKKLILVVSPPACGKTFISKKLAENLKHVVYLDKDTLVPLSNVVFDCANQERNRSSEFFEKYIRNVEYDVTMDFALEALKYEDCVLINAPFTREIRDNVFMKDLRNRLKEQNCGLYVVWVETKLEICRQRMISRNSPRDTWKLEHWDEYIATRDFNVPRNLYEDGVVDKLLIFHNSSQEEYEASMKEVIEELEK